MPRTVLAAAGAALALLVSVPSGGDPTVSHPRVLTHFVDAGQTPENIALEPDGSADLTFAFARQVARVDRNGGTEVLATLPAVANPQTPNIGAAITTGIARAHDGTLYVGYATGDADTNGIWRIAPDGSGAERIAALPADGLPNGIALDEECDELYVADSARGVVWRVPVGGGEPVVWASGAALEPTAQLPFGANGLKLHDGAVWVSNSGQGTLLRIPIGSGPDREAGPFETRASGLTLDDFAFTGHGDTVLGARILDDALELIRPDGTHTTVLTAADGLRNPTSVAVHAKKVYVPSAAYFPQPNTTPDPNLLLARISKNKL